MTWVAWRVQRLQYLAAAAAALAVGLWLVASGLDASSSWSQTTIDADVVVLYAFPGVLGVALGAVLVASEMDRGTNRLAWTQSITPTRWLVYKVLVGGAVSGCLVALLTPLLDWWAGATGSGPDILPRMFGVTGIVAVSYVLFAFVLGAALGTLIGRPGWAFAAGLPVFAAVRLIMDGIRPTLVAPAFAIEPAQTFVSSGAPPRQKGWALNAGYLPIGRTTPAPGQTWASSSARVASCFNAAQSQAGVDRCAKLAHVHYVVEYQPESHYWMMQSVETAFYVAIAIALAAVIVASVRLWRV